MRVGPGAVKNARWGDGSTCPPVRRFKCEEPLRPALRVKVLRLGLQLPRPHTERETFASIFKSGALDRYRADAVVEADVDVERHSRLRLKSCRSGEERPQFALAVR